MTYTTQSTARLTINSTYDGMVSSNGQAFAFVDTGTCDNSIALMVGLKKSSHMSVTALTGDYLY